MNKFDLSSSIIINEKSSAIWNKIVDPASIQKWLNGAIVDTTWQLNSRVEFKFVEEPKPRFDWGKIIEILENERLVLNLWSKDYGNDDVADPYKVITYDLKYLGNNQTRLSLTVASFDTPEEVEERKHIVEKILNTIKTLVEV